MGVASEYFASVDLNDRLDLTTLDAFWTWIDEGATGRLAEESWRLVSGDDVYFRGQSSTAFGLSSKLYRDCKSAAEMNTRSSIAEADLAAVERTLLTAMGEEGIGRNMNEGQMLILLQHHGIATRLLDVSAGPKEALFFACDQHAEQDGRLFIVALPSPHGEEYDCIELGAESTLPWLGVARGRYASSEWTGRVAVVIDDALDARMRAQNGRFLVGGLARRYGGKSRRLLGRNLPAEKFAEVSTLDINFLRNKTQAHNWNWGATGWTIRVPSLWKPELLKRLAQEPEPITIDTMYPPVNEVARLARRLVRDHFARS